MSYQQKYTRKFEIDQKEYPVVVWESDDWGACEVIPEASMLNAYNRTLSKYGKAYDWAHCGYERNFEMRDLYNVLNAHAGADGVKPVFTAYTAMGNPDFRAIKESGFRTYYDIPLGEGLPEGWEDTGTIPLMLSGMEQGIWSPEYHAMLHHTSPRLWLARLRADDDCGKLARELFDMNSYFQAEHVPEYEGYSILEQSQFIRTGFQRFKKLFGRYPQAAVTSDAYPETVQLWAAYGITTQPLKNCRIHTGEVIVYPTKPWNLQDVYAKMGDFDIQSGTICLTRNVFCESGITADSVLNAARMSHNTFREPAVISSHRANYCSFDAALRAQNLERLDAILTEFDRRGVYYLTSTELSSIYEKGWSARQVGDKILYRQWFENIEVPGSVSHLGKGNHWLPASTVIEPENDYVFHDLNV